MTNQRNYWNQMADYGANASVIDPYDKRGHKNYYIKWLRDQAFLSLIDQSNGPAKVLDFGCGSGNISTLLAAHGHQVIGIDISLKLLNLATAAERDGNPGFTCYDGSTLPIRPDSIDVVTTYVVLGHITDDEALLAVLNELFRCLKPGGRVLAIEQTRKSQKMTDNGYKRQRRQTDYQALFTSAGFTSLDSFSIRSGHMPLIYLIQLGLLPESVFPFLARFEQHYSVVSKQLGDYIDTVFVLAKPDASTRPANHD